MNFKKNIAYLSAALLVCTLIRIFQIIFLVEYSNGFYYVGKGLLGNLCMVLIALICAGLVFFAFKTEKTAVAPPKTDWLLAIISVVVAVTLFRELFGENMPMTMTAGQVFSIKMLTVFTAVYFIVFCMQYIMGFKMPPLLHIMPIIYATAKTIFTFINLSSLALISDNILLLASYCSLMLLFISYGKLHNGIEEKRGFTKFLATSCVSAVITITASMPNIIINLFSKQPYIHTNTDVLITLFAFGVFAIVFICKSVDKKEHI